MQPNVFTLRCCHVVLSKVKTSVVQRSCAPNITKPTAHTAELLPSCFLSTQEVSSARGVGGRVREVVSGQSEGAGGRPVSVRQRGAGGLGRTRRPHQGHQGAHPGGAEEDRVGGAGPAVDTHRNTQNNTHTDTQQLSVHDNRHV